MVDSIGGSGLVTELEEGRVFGSDVRTPSSGLSAAASGRDNGDEYFPDSASSLSRRRRERRCRLFSWPRDKTDRRPANSSVETEVCVPE